MLDDLGVPRIVFDEINDSETLASAIYVPQYGEYLVGNTAKEEAVEHPDTTFQGWKQYIGRGGVPGVPTYQAYGMIYDPVTLSQIVLEKIVDYAKDSGETVEDVVITCPAYFDLYQREATKQAGQLAGLNVLAVINEPTAAVWHYCLNHCVEQETKMLVYDLGGSGFNVTVLKVRLVDGIPRVDILYINGDDTLGGRNWDEILCQLILEKIEEEYGIYNAYEDAALEFLWDAEYIKWTLSRRDKAIVRERYDGYVIRVAVTREEFEARTRAKLDQTIRLTDEVLDRVGCSDDGVDVVLAIGGATLMPQVQDMLRRRFGDKVCIDDPKFAVAKGAAMIANGLPDDHTAVVQDDLESGCVQRRGIIGY